MPVPLEVYSNSRWTQRYAAVSGLFALVGLVVVIVHPSSWKGWFVLVFFGVITLFLVKDARNRKPRLVVDDAGIWGSGLPRKLAWEEVADIFETFTTTRFSTIYFVGVVPRDPSVIGGGVRRALSSANKVMSGAPLTTPISNMQMTPDEIMRRVAEFHPVSSRK